MGRVGLFPRPNKEKLLPVVSSSNVVVVGRDQADTTKFHPSGRLHHAVHPTRVASCISTQLFATVMTTIAHARGNAAKFNDSPRSILVGMREQREVFPPNTIKTSIYTPYNFVAKNFFKQFTRFSNIYFLFITVLQLLPDVTSSNGVPTMIVPLLIIIVVSGVKDVIEDLQRHRADAQQNEAPVHKLYLDDVCDHRFQQGVCADLKVGALVRVAQNEEIPADITILAVSQPNSLCYVTTANLDGESSLKPRYVHGDLCTSEHRGCFSQEGHLTTDANTRLAGMTLECEAPNRRIDKFQGSIKPLGSGDPLQLDVSHILFRGTYLKDTAWVIGIVIYTGDDTRIRQNASETPIKLSWLYHFINRMTMWIVLAQILLLVIAVVVEKQMVDSQRVINNPYIASETKAATTTDCIWLFLAYMLLFSNFVPISLQVTVDFTRYLQSQIITSDKDMQLTGPTLVGDPNGIPIKKRMVCVKSSELNEELGLVEHIFTDKTGTLTCNRMEFRCCHVSGKSYHFDGQRGKLRVFERVSNTNSFTLSESSTLHNYADLRMNAYLQRFLINLAVNNSVSIVPNHTPSILGAEESMEYIGSSPDERALVIAAEKVGVRLCKRDNQQVVLSIDREDLVLEVLHKFEFTSDRKKSSLLCRQPDGRLMLLCKGADSVILPALSEKNNTGKIRQATEQMKTYCSNGLRVLCVAEREVSAEEYKRWSDRYIAMRNKRPTISEDELSALVSELEQELMLVGVSAIEDKIQEGAPAALEKFREAGIKVWMLTGDRPDTATNVAHSVRLISSDMKVINLCDTHLMGDKLNALRFLENATSNSTEDAQHYDRFAVLVNDTTIETVTALGIEKQFVELCLRCSSVLCARISPKQKERIVGMVRKQFPDKVTMAVGDGANDVPMIQRAHIGVGIAGEEGQQAADAGDYSLPTFKCLQYLVLVHGRSMNRRIGMLTLYIFYKNVLLVLPQFVYGGYCLFSGQSTYYDSLLQLFNVCFTALPIMYYAVYDQDVSPPMALAYPKLYQDGYLHSFLNIKIFLYWMFEAIISSILIAVVPTQLLPLASWSGEGKDNDLWALGLTQNFIVVFLANIRLVLEISNDYSRMILLILASLVCWWAIVYVLGSYIVYQREFYGILYVGELTSMLLCCLLCTAIGLLPAFAPRVWEIIFAPYPRTICRELDYLQSRGNRGLETVHPIETNESSIELIKARIASIQY